jgi:hypothetical protein
MSRCRVQYKWGILARNIEVPILSYIPTTYALYERPYHFHMKSARSASGPGQLPHKYYYVVHIFEHAWMLQSIFHLAVVRRTLFLKAVPPLRRKHPQKIQIENPATLTFQKRFEDNELVVGYY